VDNSGNLEAVHSQLLQVDKVVPSVSLTAPANNAVAAGTITLSATGSDNVGVARIDFLIDGVVVGTSTTSPYTASWNSASMPDGRHTVTAKAFDLAGNSTTSTAATITTTNVNLLQNPGLEQGSGITPTCWLLGGYGTNAFAWTWTTDAHSGTHAENLTVTSYTNGDRKMLNAFNSTCSIATQPGAVYTVTVWYKSTAKPVIFAFTSTSGANGPYVYFAQSPLLAIAGNWTSATWTTPPMPAGTTNLSVGLGFNGATGSTTGSVTMDDFGAFRTG
jgi:hypothetical protein